MNTVWEVLLKEQEAGVCGIRFVPAKSPSPYAEVLPAPLNAEAPEEGQEIEVNPYCRFYSIFRNYFPPDHDADSRLREALYDPLIRYLGRLDLHSGMHKQRYYHRFLAGDFQAGVFGSRNWERYASLSRRDREILERGILSLYRTGDSPYARVMRAMFPHCLLYCGEEGGVCYYLYLGEEKTEENRNKTELAAGWFLPVRAGVRLYWKQHFCILGEESLSVIGSIALA